MSISTCWPREFLNGLVRETPSMMCESTSTWLMVLL
jgi:hypothetical protein